MEPASAAIGLIGFSATLFNFLLTTISDIAAAKRRLVDIRSWYLECTALLLEAQQVIESWAMLWCQPEYSVEDYAVLWGPNGLDDIKMRMAEIETTIREIVKLLRFEGEVDPMRQFVRDQWERVSGDYGTSGAKKEWNQAITANGYCEAMQRLEIKAVTRVAFALYNEKALSEKASRLRNYVTTLESHSIRLFKNSGNWWQSSSVERSDISSSLRYHEMIRTAEELNEVCRQDDCNAQWALELSRVDHNAEVDLSLLQGIQVLNFVVGFPRQPGVRFSTTHVNVRTTRSLPADLSVVTERQQAVAYVLNQPRTAYRQSNGLLMLCEQTDGVNTQFSWRPTLSKQLLAMQSDIVAAKAAEQQRAHIAAALSVHVVALWSTGWVANICSCAIREFFGVGHDESKYALRTYCRIPGLLNCQRGYKPEYRLLLLGVVISELVLGRPLPLDYHAEGRPTLRSSDNSNNDIALGRRTFQDIAWEVEQLGGRRIGNAIEFCFGPDQRWSTPNLNGEEVKVLLREVVQPVHRWATVVQNGPNISGNRNSSERRAYQLFYDYIKQQLFQLYQGTTDTILEEHPRLVEECHSMIADDVPV